MGSLHIAASHRQTIWVGRRARNEKEPESDRDGDSFGQKPDHRREEWDRRASSRVEKRRGELRGTDSEGYAAPALLSSPVPIVDEKETKHMQGPQCTRNGRFTSSEKVY